MISRAGTGPVGATQLRNVLSGDLYFTEYSDPLSPAIFGHAMAAGATAVAAYDPFKSYLPEPYTSPGGRPAGLLRLRRASATASRRSAGCRRGQLRPREHDVLRGRRPPRRRHAAELRRHQRLGTARRGIAALVLQKAGGGKSLSPQRCASGSRPRRSTTTSTPSAAVARRGADRVRRGEPGPREGRHCPGSINDPHFFRVSYSGKVPLKSLTFFGETASPTALGKRNPPKSDGIVFDKRPFAGLRRAATRASRSRSARSPVACRRARSPRRSRCRGRRVGPGQYRRLTLNFKSGLKCGQGLQFGVDRDLAISGLRRVQRGQRCRRARWRDLPAAGHGRPRRAWCSSATLGNGKKISGVFTNRLGHGWTPVDGFGLINAEKAVLGR